MLATDGSGRAGGITIAFLALWKVPEAVLAEVALAADDIRLTVALAVIQVTVQISAKDSLWVTVAVHAANSRVVAKRLRDTLIALFTSHSLWALTITGHCVTGRRTVTGCKQSNQIFPQTKRLFIIRCLCLISDVRLQLGNPK